MRAFAGVAQSVEQLIRNEKVGGSIPLSGTNKIKHLAPLTRRGFVASDPACRQFGQMLADSQPKKCGALAGAWASLIPSVLSDAQPAGRSLNRTSQPVPPAAWYGLRHVDNRTVALGVT
jgi:hypothetical protein